MENSDFDMWCQKWDKAVESGLFKNVKAHVPTPLVGSDDYFGVHAPADNSVIHNDDAKYWNDVYRLSGNEPVNILNENKETKDFNLKDVDTKYWNNLKEGVPVTKDELVATDKPDNKSVAKITDELGDLPQKVARDTREADGRRKVTPDWSGGEQLTALHALKEKLQELESKMNAAMGKSEVTKMRSFQKKVNNLRKEMDDLSNSLTVGHKTDYLS